MARGGKRPGAGRKKGLPTKRTIERHAVVQKAIAEGRTPIDVMLDNMRHFDKVAHDAEAVLESLAHENPDFAKMEPEEQFKVMLAKVKHAAGLRMLAQTCAEGAAPMIHPRLSPTEAAKPAVVNHNYFIGNVDVNVTQVRNELSTIFDHAIPRSPAKDAKRVN